MNKKVRMFLTQKEASLISEIRSLEKGTIEKIIVQQDSISIEKLIKYLSLSDKVKKTISVKPIRNINKSKINEQISLFNND